MRYFVKSKRKHGRTLRNPEDFRWFNGYPDQAVMGLVNEPHVKTKIDAFNAQVEWVEKRLAVIMKYGKKLNRNTPEIELEKLLLDLQICT